MTQAEVLEQGAGTRTYQQFLDFLKDPDIPAPVLSPKRFSQAMHIDLQDLAEQARVHRNTITRAPDSRQSHHADTAGLRRRGRCGMMISSGMLRKHR